MHALDFFLLHDADNNKFLSFEEIQEQLELMFDDHMEINTAYESKEQFMEKMQDAYGPKAKTFVEFHKFATDMQLLDLIECEADHLYNQRYSKCCLCFKSCFKRIRKTLVKVRLD